MFKIINFRVLSEICDIDYFKLRNNIVAGKYNSMTKQERTEVANGAFLAINKFFNRLGFTLKMERTKERVPEMDTQDNGL